jgi:hypothetical protein
MKLQQNFSTGKTAFKGGGFYTFTGELDKNIMLSRAIVDILGCDIPWIAMANNKQEREEKTRRCIVNFSIAFLSPFITLPLTNRIAMKWAGLTDKFWSNNHKAIHISNEHLKNSADMKSSLEEIAKRTTQGPIEAAFHWIRGGFGKFIQNVSKNEKTSMRAAKWQNPNKTMDIPKLIENAGTEELLRKKLIRAKGGVLAFDIFLTAASMGSIIFLNNYLTKKKTGQAGFSAEMSMADREIVEKRAERYEKTKNLRYAGFLTTCAVVAAANAALVNKGMLAKEGGKFGKFLQDRFSGHFDYRKGIYMAKWPLFLTAITYHTSTLFASRNDTEFKDNLIRSGFGDICYFGGDVVLAMIFRLFCDKAFKTNLIKPAAGKKFNKVHIEDLTKEIKKLGENPDANAAQIKRLIKDRKFASGILWLSILTLGGFLGLTLPTLINRMIRRDVSKDVLKNAANTAQTPLNLTDSPAFKNFNL